MWLVVCVEQECARHHPPRLVRAQRDKGRGHRTRRPVFSCASAPRGPVTGGRGCVVVAPAQPRSSSRPTTVRTRRAVDAAAAISTRRVVPDPIEWPLSANARRRRSAKPQQPGEPTERGDVRKHEKKTPGYGAQYSMDKKGRSAPPTLSVPERRPETLDLQGRRVAGGRVCPAVNGEAISGRGGKGSVRRGVRPGNNATSRPAAPRSGDDSWHNVTRRPRRARAGAWTGETFRAPTGPVAPRNAAGGGAPRPRGCRGVGAARLVAASVTRRTGADGASRTMHGVARASWGGTRGTSRPGCRARIAARRSVNDERPDADRDDAPRNYPVPRRRAAP